MVLWGVVTRSPREAMRDYMGDQSTLAAASGTDRATLAEPSVERVLRTYAVPGCPGATIEYDGYADEGLDCADQAWSTAEVVQAIGRLRACRRGAERLTVHVWAARPLADAHGMRVDEVSTVAPWRTATDRRQDGAEAQVERVAQAAAQVVALRRADRPAGRAAVRAALRSRGLQGVGSDRWQAVLRIAETLEARARRLHVPGADSLLRRHGPWVAGRGVWERLRVVWATPAHLQPGWMDRVLARRMAAVAARQTERMRA